MPPSASKFPIGWVLLFLSPFCLIGVFLILAGIGVVKLEGNPQPLVLLGVGLAFAGAGFGFCAVIILSGRGATKQAELETRHPTEPWMWREDWAQHRISSTAAGSAAGLWVFAVIWNAISAPIAWLAFREGSEDPMALFLMLFPIVGFFLLIAAIQKTLQAARYGRSFLVFQNLPIKLGTRFNARLETASLPEAVEKVRTRVVCIRQTSHGSGKSRTTHRRILWEDDREIGRNFIHRGPNGVAVPVEFHLPHDQEETRTISSDDRIYWQVDISAEVPGVDYEGEFEIPVFGRVEGSSETPLRETRELAAYKPSEIVVESVSEGRRYRFPAGRRKDQAVLGTIFTVIWLAATYALIHFSAPAGFPICFGLFGFLCVYGVLDAWLGRATITASREELIITRTSGLIESTKRVRFQDISDVGIHSPAMADQQQQEDAAKHQVQIELADGGKINAGRPLVRKREADWLVKELRGYLPAKKTGSPEELSTIEP